MVSWTHPEKERGASVIRCPRCKNQTQDFFIEGITIELCSHCQGTWFARGALLYFLKASAGLSDLKLVHVGEFPAQIDCPHCQVQMARESFSVKSDAFSAVDKNLEIDRCPRCEGVWLDSGEFEKAKNLAKELGDAQSQFRRVTHVIDAQRNAQLNRPINFFNWKWGIAGAVVLSIFLSQCFKQKGPAAPVANCVLCQGSGKVLDVCRACNGSGKILFSGNANAQVCSECSGRGISSGNSEVCAVCRGSGSMDGEAETCSACRGKGELETITKRTCSRCGGLGRMDARESCPTCNGSGKSSVNPQWGCAGCGGTGSVTKRQTCANCLGGIVETKSYRRCVLCRGTGQVKSARRSCASCLGTGRAASAQSQICWRCGGRGFLGENAGSKVCSSCQGVGNFGEKICSHCNGKGKK